MKIKLFLLLFVLPFIAYNQEATAVTETIESIEEVSGSALKSTIYYSNDKSILRAFKNTLKNYNGKVKIKGNELTATEVVITSIADHEIKVYAKVKELNAFAHEVFFIFLDGSNFISSSSDISGYTAAKDIVYNFSNTQNQNSTESHFEKQEKKLSELEEGLNDLVKEKKKAEEEIEDCKELIKDNEYKIKENIDDQERVAKEIEEQKGVVKKARNAKDIFD